MTHGIEILLTGLNSVEIAADGQSAKIGGGIRSKNLTDALWAAGKQTGMPQLCIILVELAELTNVLT